MRFAAHALLALSVLPVVACAPTYSGDDANVCPNGCDITPPAPTPTGCTTDASCDDPGLVLLANDGACYPADQLPA